MLGSIFNRGSIPALEALMRFSSARHRAIANNIANVETVGYKAMDVREADFQKALSRAFEEQRRSPLGLFEMPQVGSVRPTARGLELRIGAAQEAGMLKHIDNNVDLDLEMGRLVKNNSLHGVVSTLLSHEFGMIRSAIQERAVA